MVRAATIPDEVATQTTAPYRLSRYTALIALALPLIVIVGLGVVLVSAKPSIGADPVALARVSLPFGAGSVEHVSVVGGREQRAIPVELRGDRIWPTGTLPVHELVTIEVVVKRPGVISWLSGSTERISLTLRTPSSSLRSHYLTVKHGSPLRLRFSRPVSVVEYGPAGHLTRHVLASPVLEYDLTAATTAGTMSVAAAPRGWESPTPTLISWFPSGTAASAVAIPQPGSTISPTAPITLTFNKPIAKALGTTLPPVSPAGAGSWRTINSHTIRFEPAGYGYGLGATVKIPLPAGVHLVGAQQSGSDPGGSWQVPAGTTTRLQQLLAMLGYLPVDFKYSGAGVTPTPANEINAAIHPPAGSFSWRYPDTPSALRSFWQPGAAGVITRGAVMAFENANGMSPDGVAGPAVWKSLIAAAVADRKSTFGYTFVMVSEGSPESIDVWHSGRSVLSAAVNTGISAAPTATGTYPVFEHIPVGTMSGKNPDGSTYHDPGIPWISYFNGGDALHGFIRASYGFPQSLGCVEMQLGPAGQVWPYTPIGTLVHVA